MTETEKESNYLSPSRLIKWLFSEKYKNIPEWILERAAEQGKDYHELIEAYINGADINDIEELLYSEKDKRVFQAFKNWYDNLKKSTTDIKSEFYIKNDEGKLHGYIDLIDFENNIFYDFKFRNLKQELDITAEILQMLFYEKCLKNHWDWVLVFIDKNTGQIQEFKKSDLFSNDYWNYHWILIDAINLYKNITRMEHQIWNKKKTLKI